MTVSVEARPAPGKAMAVSDNRATRSTGPGRGARGQQRNHLLPNFARNLSWSFFDTPQKRCNSNDANSMFEQAAGELRVKLMDGGGARPGIETTHRATHQRPSPTGAEGARGSCRGAGGRRRGLAGLRDDTPNQTTATRPHWCGGRRRDRRARAGFEARRRTK